MAMEYEASLKFMYDDATTRTYKFSPVSSADLNGIRDKVKAINANVTDDLKQTFLSKDGSPFMRIAEASYTGTEEEVIYRG